MSSDALVIALPLADTGAVLGVIMLVVTVVSVIAANIAEAQKKKRVQERLEARGVRHPAASPDGPDADLFEHPVTTVVDDEIGASRRAAYDRDEREVARVDAARQAERERERAVRREIDQRKQRVARRADEQRTGRPARQAPPRPQVPQRPHSPHRPPLPQIVSPTGATTSVFAGEIGSGVSPAVARRGDGSDGRKGGRQLRDHFRDPAKLRIAVLTGIVLGPPVALSGSGGRGPESGPI